MSERDYITVLDALASDDYKAKVDVIIDPGLELPDEILMALAKDL